MPASVFPIAYYIIGKDYYQKNDQAIKKADILYHSQSGKQNRRDRREGQPF